MTDPSSSSSIPRRSTLSEIVRERYDLRSVLTVTVIATIISIKLLIQRHHYRKKLVKRKSRSSSITETSAASATTSAVPVAAVLDRNGIPVHPKSHWLLGHLSQLRGCGDFQKTQYNMFARYANSNGHTSFYLPWNRQCVSVLHYKDFQKVLLCESNRKTLSIMIPHVHQFLGSNNIGVIQGKTWKFHRMLITKAFSSSSVYNTHHKLNVAITHVTTIVINTILQKYFTATTTTSSSSLSNGGITTTSTYDTNTTDGFDSTTDTSTSDDTTDVDVDVDDGIILNIEEIMKMITVDIFGIVALSQTDESQMCCPTLTPSKVGVAFEYLLKEFTRRIYQPFNPFTTFYWIPTPSNMRHKKERTYLRNYLAKIIKQRQQEQEEEHSNGSTTHGSSNGGGGIRTKKNDKKTMKSNDLISLILQAHKEQQEQQRMEDTINGGSSNNGLSSSTTISTQTGLTDTWEDIMLALLFAGYDTTTITLTYAIYCISQHPTIEEKCLEEIRRMEQIEQERERVDNDDEYEDSPYDPMDDLVYIQGVIMETLRLYPPGPQGTRHLRKSIVLPTNNTKIEGDTTVYLPFWTVHRDPTVFPQPLQFIPERWVKQVEGEDGKWIQREEDPEEKSEEKGDSEGGNDESATATIRVGNRKSHFAFSGGARSCAGQRFAMREAVGILARLLSKLKFTSLEGYELRPQRIGIIQRPEFGMPMKITLRK